MKNALKKVGMGLFAAGVVAVIASATATAAGPRPIGCFKNLICLDVWRPVLCPNGLIYSNDCYAARACQTGCTPAGAI
jgi:hypothetical protein